MRWLLPIDVSVVSPVFLWSKTGLGIYEEAYLELGDDGRHYMLGKQFVQRFLCVMRCTFKTLAYVLPLIQSDTYLHTHAVIKRTGSFS